MHKKDRTPEIFGMSALDLFASGMGAFFLMVLILFPYYKNTSEVDMRERLNQLLNKLQECQQQATVLSEELETLERKKLQIEADTRACELDLAKSYLVIVVEWDARGHDIDLHVVDPEGREFYFGAPTKPGSDAELSADTTFGPGIEVWEIPIAAPGEYKVYYKFFSDGGNRVPSLPFGAVYYRNGSIELPVIWLYHPREKPLVATIQVEQGGNIVIR